MAYNEKRFKNLYKIMKRNISSCQIINKRCVKILNKKVYTIWSFFKKMSQTLMILRKIQIQFESDKFFMLPSFIVCHDNKI